MKLTNTLLIAAALAVAPMAFASPVIGQMSGGGGDTFTDTTITLTGPFLTTGDTGIFAGLNGGTVTFTSYPLPYTTPSPYPATFIYSVTGAGVNSGETVNFYSTSDTYSLTPYTDPVSGDSDLSLMINGVGYFTSNFFSGQIAGSYSLTTQGEPNPNGSTTSVVTFSGTTDAVASAPEPATFALLGGGLVAAAFFRRRKIAVKA